MHRARPISCVQKSFLRLGLIACLSALANCGTSTEQVRPLGDGTYLIGIKTQALTEQADAIGEAVRKGGAFCHAKNQKIQIVTNSAEKDVHFRCVGSSMPLAADPAAEAAADPAGPAKEETH